MNFNFHQNIGIYGFGVEGKSLYTWLKKHGAKNVFIFGDTKKTEEGAHGQPNFCFDTPSIAEETISEQDVFSLPLEQLNQLDIIFRSPGVHPAKILKHIGAENSEKISSATQLFFDLCPTQEIVGVTGTKGKGTTSSLITTILKAECLENSEKQLTKEERDIYNVSYRNKSEITLLGRNNESFLYKKGNRRFGANKIINRHYGENSIGFVTKKEIINIGSFLRTAQINPTRTGKNKFGKTIVFEIKDKNILLSLIILYPFGKTIPVVMNFYSNRNMYFTKKEGVDTSSQQSPSFDTPIIAKININNQDYLENSEKQVFLGGNIGTPVFDFFDEIQKDDIIVLELSSFQLYDLKKSPKIAVLLRTDTEHLDWHSDTQDYRNAKTNIFAHQKKGDTFIYFGGENSEIGKNNIVKKMIQSAPEISEKISVFSEDEDVFITVENQKILGTVFTNNENSENSPEILTSDIPLRGAFHQENILPAIAVAKQFGVENSVIKKCISEFSGLPMRCEKIETENSKKQNIQFFNDSFSTIPETSISAISILKTPLYLILGGSEKNSDFSGLAQAISMNTNIIKVYLVGKTAIKISEELEIHGYDDFLCMKNLEEIFQDFKKEAQSGDSLLLSPACASFGMFKNYKERGERFNELVGKF